MYGVKGEKILAIFANLKYFWVQNSIFLCLLWINSNARLNVSLIVLYIRRITNGLKNSHVFTSWTCFVFQKLIKWGILHDVFVVFDHVTTAEYILIDVFVLGIPIGTHWETRMECSADGFHRWGPVYKFSSNDKHNLLGLFNINEQEPLLF